MIKAMPKERDVNMHLYCAAPSNNLISRTSAPIPNPTAIMTRPTATATGTISAAVGLGITVRSNGNIATNLATTPAPIAPRAI